MTEWPGLNPKTIRFHQYHFFELGKLVYLNEFGSERRVIDEMRDDLLSAIEDLLIEHPVQRFAEVLGEHK